jgi:hypothetical protein
MNIKSIIIFLLILGNFNAYAAKSKSAKTAILLSDSAQTSGISPFQKLTLGSKIQKGMFTVYKKAGNYYFEIPDSLLGRDMLLGSRVVSISDNGKISAGQRRSNPVLISFSKRDKLLFMHQPTGKAISDPGDPLTVALARNNMVPIAMTFDIAVRNNANDASLIDVTKLFSAEVDLVFPAGMGNTGRMDTKASQILEMKSFPKNVEIKTYYAYSGGREPFSVTVGYSFVLLSKEPYRVRLSDKRMNFSSEKLTYFESGKPAQSMEIINRWRIEPRASEMEKYLKGEMVVPEKQILFYIDTIMPENWRVFVKKGIESWNETFKNTGFKDVIKAVDFPNSKNFDPDDIRNNCFRYVTSTDANAQGPQWIDPRSGEIIQGDIIWWHNVIDLLQTWRFVQTAAVDPEARAKQLNEQIMGEAIQYAVAHEMGHVLGFQHNMRASFSYPTDSLRSATFTKKYGTTASIMDYARNNFIAQPGDKEKGVVLSPLNPGPFDYFAIQYGYQIIENAKNAFDEIPTLNKWFLDKGKDPVFMHAGTVISTILPDPSAQSDMLGDDIVKSAKYGISNIKIILKNLSDWTLEKNDNFDLLQKRYDGLLKQYFKLTGNTVSNLGGVYDLKGVFGQHQANFDPVEKAKQKETLAFLMQEMSDTDWWNLAKANKHLGSTTEEIMKWQQDLMANIMSTTIAGRLISNMSLYPENAYTFAEYLQDVDQMLWAKTSGPAVNILKQNLQIQYIMQLKKLSDTSELINKSNPGNTNILITAAARTQLSATRLKINALIKAEPSKSAHYNFLIQLLEK